jgi:hypothetical protein
MAILDSGSRREFESGAVRDIAEGKGRCDLLPLDVIYKFIERPEIIHINDYIHTGTIDCLFDTLESFVLMADEFPDIITAILEVSKQYEEGAKKYSDRNWEKGMPVHCFIDSALRHFFKYLRGDTDEPHSRAFIWNILGAIWMHENHPELIDLPFKEALHE